jgi:hypothetical protein
MRNGVLISKKSTLRNIGHHGFGTPECLVSATLFEKLDWKVGRVAKQNKGNGEGRTGECALKLFMLRQLMFRQTT